MQTVLITGCDYGIGLELASQYAAAGWHVHALCLQPASRASIVALGEHAHFHNVDVADQGAVQALADKMTGTTIDVLINNAATFAPDGAGALQLPEREEFVRVMHINAVAPVYVAEAFVEHVSASTGKTMAFISTRSGSIGDNTSGGHYAYRCSKAALNMAVRSIAVDLEERAIMSVALHPGSVATPTRKGGQISVADSVSGLRAEIAAMTPTRSGTFRRYDGGTIEW